MDDAIESPADAKGIAKAILTDRYPGTEEWFDLAWDVFHSGSRAAKAGVSPTEMVLGIAGRNNPATRQMAREVAILFEALMQKFPAVREEILQRLELACEHNGNSRASTKVLRKDLQQKMAENFGFVVWHCIRDRQTVNREEGTYSELACKLPRDKYDIFIDDKLAYKLVPNGKSRRLESVQVELSPTPLRVAIALLRYKGQALGVDEICGAGRRGPESNELADLKIEESSDPAKVMVHRVKQVFSDLQNFKIEYLDCSYRCSGSFSFCICVRKIFEQQFTLPGR